MLIDLFLHWTHNNIVAGLSGGQRKLLLFELIYQRTAKMNDLLLVLDEPFAGVTDDFVPWIVNRLDEMGKKHNVLLVTNDHVNTLKEMAERAAVWYQPLTHYDEVAVAKQFVPSAVLPLQTVREELANLSEWNPAAIHAAMQSTGEKLGVGLGKIGPALRVAITGSQQSP